MKIVSLIPLRGWSKSIPYKNIKPLAGKPLCNRTIEASLNSKYISETRVSTDDPKIKEIALFAGAKVLNRPEEFATDTASTESVMLHFMEHVDFDLLVTIQATSPLTMTEDLDTAIENFKKNNYDSMLTGVMSKRFFWNPDGSALNYDPFKRPRRQDFTWTIVENWAFYITSKEVLEKDKNRLWGKIGIYEMDEKTFIEIDEPEDRNNIEKIINTEPQYSSIDLNKISVIFSDFDWVWTDNKVMSDSNGNEILTFSKYDSLWLDYFQKKYDIPLIVLSKEKNSVVKKRCEKLNLTLISDIDNKLLYIENYIKKHNLSWDNVCYIWNDINDYNCIQKAAYSFCPYDSDNKIKNITKYILNHNGWEWAVREMLNVLTKNNLL